MIRFRFLGLFCFFLWSTAAFCSPVVAPTASLSLYDVRLSDLARIVFGDLLKRSYQFDSEVIDSTEDVTVNWLNLSLSEIERQTRMFFVSFLGFCFVFFCGQLLRFVLRSLLLLRPCLCMM